MSARLGNLSAHSGGHPRRCTDVSKKKDRAWFVWQQWGELVSQHYASDAAAGRALNTHPKVLTKIREGTPVAKSTVLKMLRRLASRHALGTALSDLVVDTRARR